MKRVITWFLVFIITLSTWTNVVMAETETEQVKESSLSVPSVTAVNETVYKDTVQQSVYQSTVQSSVYQLLQGMELAADGEILNLRSRNTKHYLQEDGSITAVISAEDVHYEDQNGKYQEIQNELVDEEELNQHNSSVSKAVYQEYKEKLQQNKRMGLMSKGKKQESEYFRLLHSPFDAAIPKTYSKGYSIGKDGQKLTLIPVNASESVGQLNETKDAITYFEAWPSTDVTLHLFNNGVKEDIVLKDKDAPTHFEFEVVGQLKDDLESGEIHITPAFLIDANGERRDVTQKVRHSQKGTLLELDADVSNLSYPITIDPTVNFTGVSQAASYLVDSPNETYIYHVNGANVPLGAMMVFGRTQSGDAHYITKLQLDNIPDNTVLVNSARLEIKNSIIPGYTYAGTIKVRAEMVTQDWDARTTTYNTRPSVSNSIFGETVQLSTNAGESPSYWDITNIARAWYDGTPNYGVYLHANLDGATTLNKRVVMTSKIFNTISLNYSLVPTPPTATSPNGGETIDAQKTITWNASTDPVFVQSSLKYQVQLSTDGGANWSDIVPLTAAGATSVNYDFSSIPATNNAFIRVRGYNGTNYGKWDVSDAPFRIKHNLTPNAPINVTPGSTSTPVIVSVSPSVSWTFSDPDVGDWQTAYEVLVYNSQTWTPVHDSGWINSGVGSYTVPNGVLARGTNYSWFVRVKDSKGAISPYSTALIIQPNQIPVANVTSYANNQQIPDNVLTFNWTYSDANGQTQTAYQVVGTKDNWATWAYDSGVVYSAAASHSTPALSQGAWSFAVRAFDGMEWSDWSFRSNMTLPNSYEPNDSTATAFQISYGQQYSTLIGTPTDVDVFKYTANHTGIDKAVLQAPAGKDYDVYIYDSNQVLLADGIAANNVWYLVESGKTYYIKIAGANGSYSATEAYNFIVNPFTLNYQTNYQFDNNGNLQTKSTSGK